MKFNIITLGCKVNTYESEIMKELLIKNNYEYTDFDNADIIIVNTCSVTNMADNKSKKIVRRAKRYKKIVVACGCSTENIREDYKSMDIDILLGNKDKSKIVEILDNYLKNHQKQIIFYDREKLEFEDMTVQKFNSLTRAFVKIQDGCNNFCSYCIIPYTRGNLRSKDFENCVEEVKTLVLNGHKEIVLTGIHTGSYQDKGRTLPDLIKEISKIENLKRIRISSIEVTELNDKMIEEIKNNPKIVNHFHIPLQAGTDKVLKIMNRKYDLNYYKSIINKIREVKKDVSITTDCIVGHPFETEEDFLKTLETCKKLNFAKIHVFPYSKRTGTKSSEMDQQVSEEEKKRRSRELNLLSKELEENFYRRHVGFTLEILVEKVMKNYSVGSSTNYIKVRINKKLKRNELYNVKITDYKDNYLIGVVI